MAEWFVLYSKPRQERLLKGQLERRSIDAYLPLYPRRGRRQLPEPLFPRYLFARVDAEQMSPELVKWLPGLTSFVRFGEDYATVPENVVSEIRQQTDQMHMLGVAPFEQGQCVRIVGNHPLGSLRAVFDRPLSGGARARIFVGFLGRLNRCEVDMRDLEAADDSCPKWDDAIVDQRGPRY